MTQLAGAAWLVVAAINASSPDLVLLGTFAGLGIALLVRPSVLVVRLGFVLSALVLYALWSGVVDQLFTNYDRLWPPVIAALLTVFANVGATPTPPKEPPPELI